MLVPMPDYFALLSYESLTQAMHAITGSDTVKINSSLLTSLSPVRPLLAKSGARLPVRSTQTTPLIALDITT